MSRDLYPIIFHNILQSYVTTQRSQPSLTCKLSNCKPFNVLHSMLLKSFIFLLKSFEIIVYLVNQKLTFQIFKWKIVQTEYSEVSLHIPWVTICLKLFLCYFTINISNSFCYESWNVECEQIYHFINSVRSFHIVCTHEF